MKLLITSVFLSITLSLFGQVDNHTCLSVTDKIKINSDSVLYDNSFISNNKQIGHIKNSKSDFEIRYYYSPSLVNGGQVTIISCLDDRIKVKRVDYWFSTKRSYERRRISKTKTVELTPIKSWNSFFDSLETMNFYNFPTMTTIRPKMKKFITMSDGRVVEKRSMITDGAIYSFEIKVGSDIRIFSYHSPEAWYKAYENVDELRQATTIIDFFSNSFKESNSR